MVKVSSHDELERFLKGKPVSWAVVIASRCALRVLPISNQAFSEINFHADIFLPLCRGLAAATVLATWPTAKIIAYANNALRAADAAADITAKSASTDNDRFFYSAHAAAAAARAAVIVHADDVFDAAADAAFLAVDAAEVAAQAAAAAADEAWDAVSLDLSSLEQGDNISVVMRTPLWNDGPPKDIQTHWQSLKASLPVDENWWVWTDWYEEQLTGTRNRNRSLELDRVSIPDEDWAKGPAHVNQLLSDIEREHAADTDYIPASRPATIETTLGDDGRLHLKDGHHPDLTDGALENRLGFAWEAMRDHLDDLIELDPGKNTPPLKRALVALDKAFGNEFDLMNVIASGIHGARVSALAARADDYLPAELAEDVKSFGASFEPFIRQFPEWIEYLQSTADVPSDADVSAAISFIRDVFEKAELIADDLKSALSNYAREAEDIMYEGAAFVEIHKADFVNSVNNVLVAMVNFIAPAGNWLKARAIKASERAVENTLWTSTVGILIDGAARISVLPPEFAWISSVIRMLGKAI